MTGPARCLVSRKVLLAIHMLLKTNGVVIWVVPANPSPARTRRVMAVFRGVIDVGMALNEYASHG
jgi:hypothetical protein